MDGGPVHTPFRLESVTFRFDPGQALGSNAAPHKPHSRDAERLSQDFFVHAHHFWLDRYVRFQTPAKSGVYNHGFQRSSIDGVRSTHDQENIRTAGCTTRRTAATSRWPDVKQMVLDDIDFQVIDAKTGDDLTRTILLQIILDEEAGGMPMFSSRDARADDPLLRQRAADDHGPATSSRTSRRSWRSRRSCRTRRSRSTATR